MDYIEYMPPIFDEFMQITCAYNYTENFEMNDLIDAYTEFHWSYYVSLITTLIAFHLHLELVLISCPQTFKAGPEGDSKISFA